MKYYDLRNKDDREELRQELRRRVSCLDYLEKARHGGYCCPLCGSGTHENGTGAVKYYPETRKWACHACKKNGAAKYSGDVIDLYMHKYGTDHNTALFLMAQEQGIPIDSYTDEATSARIEDGYRHHKEERATAPLDGPNGPERPEGEEVPAGDSNEAETAPQAATETTQAPAADYTAYYERCRARLKAPEAVEYITGRGVSIETAERCGVGYDPTADPASAPGALEDTGKRHPCPRLIFPTTPAHYVGRSINPDTPKGYQKMNPAREHGAGSPGLFNTGALYSGEKVVFVLEGVFDALSVEEAGGAAVALNSASNGTILLSALKERPTKAALVLCPDNDADDTTRARTHQQFAELAEGLRGAGYRCIVSLQLAGAHKDANEALQADRGAFTAAVQATIDAAAQLEAPPEPAADQGEGAADQAPPEKKAEPLPGLLTYNEAVEIFQKADDRYLELKSFPAFSATAKIKAHDSVVIAADTGAGKSSLALNFLNDLNEAYPCIYINLEMDRITVLRRLAAIYSGLEIDRIEGYKYDERTAAAVNITLQALTGRKPLQVIQGAYMLQQIEEVVSKSVKGREEPTVVIIDHSLLVDTMERTGSRYDRFTQVSEGLRRLALRENIVLFILLQQNRTGKATDEERPRNSSLKESGSWENDATQICFLWYDPTEKRKKLLLTKNRGGSCGEFALNYWQKTQTYTEAADRAAGAGTARPAARRPSRREQQRQKLVNAYEAAYSATGGKPTVQAIAEAADVTTATVKTWLKEYGGFLVDGKQVDPAGYDAIVEQQEFIKLTPAEGTPFDDPAPAPDTGKIRKQW